MLHMSEAREAGMYFLSKMGSKKHVIFPEAGDRFMHIKLGSTWVVTAYNELTREFFMIKENSGISMIVTAEGFHYIFKKLGEYDEKDLVSCL